MEMTTCRCCGDRMKYDALDVDNEDRFLCATCVQMKLKQPAIFDWVLKVVEHKTDEHQKTYYHNLKDRW